MFDLHKSNHASTDILGHVKGEVNVDGYLKGEYRITELGHKTLSKKFKQYFEQTKNEK